MAPEGKASGKPCHAVARPGMSWRLDLHIPTARPRWRSAPAGKRVRSGHVPRWLQVSTACREDHSSKVETLPPLRTSSSERLLQRSFCFSTAMLSHAGCRKCRSLPHFLVLFKVYSQSLLIISYHIYIYNIYIHNIYIYTIYIYSSYPQ